MAELKIVKGIAPLGEFKFCAVVGLGILNEDASTRAKDVREYKTTLEVNEDDPVAIAFMDAVDDLVDGQLSKGDEIVKLPYQTHEDYDGVPEGKVWIAAKCGTEYEDKKTGEIKDINVKVYDATGSECVLPEGTGVGGGSTGKVYGKVVTWDKKEGIGATFYLSSVQIKDFVPHTFGDDIDTEMGGSFKGFNKPTDLEKAEGTSEEPPKELTRAEKRALRNAGNTTEEPQQEAQQSTTTRRRRR